jgi:peptidoglycan-N-acetylmuramic acid deacetylase
MKKTFTFLLLVNIFFISCSKIPNDPIILNQPINTTSIEKKSEKKNNIIPKKSESKDPVLIKPSNVVETSTLSKEKHGWGLSVTNNETTPGIPDSWTKLLTKYNGFFHGPTNKKLVYLSFDCGYEAGFTSKILDILKQNNVPAIFFLVGHYINTKPDLVKKMVDNGFQIGNHTLNHPDLSAISEQEIIDEVLGLNKKLKQQFGKEPIYFRPPSGEFSEYSLAVIRNLGFKTVFWSLAYRDWIPLPGGSEESYQTVMKRIHPGAVILMHTVTKDNRDALQRIIDSLKAKGYEFAPFDF